MLAGRAVRAAEAIEQDADQLPLSCMRARKTLARALTMAAAEETGATERADLLEEAMREVVTALRLAWRRNIFAYEPELRWTRALVFEARGDQDRALAEATVALRMAERCQSRLVKADIHQLLARLRQQRDEIDLVQFHQEQCRDMAWCDGPPHCYKAGLDASLLEAAAT